MNERTFNEARADAIISRALQDLGKPEVPPGSNRGPVADKALDYVGYARGNPYCAAWACEVVHEAGIPDGPKTASTGLIYQWAKANKALVSVPRMGDIGCLLDTESSTGFEHTVLVVHNFGDGVVHTIAANESNMVRLNVYPVGKFKFVRPYRA